jgi:glutamate synthase domain-containing protein 1
MAPRSGRAGHGLYDPTNEHDACGVAFVARLGAPASHEVIARALWALEHLEHRGAEGADADTGDGAGILIQLPDAFLREEVPFELPSPGATASASASCPATTSPASTPSA